MATIRTRPDGTRYPINAPKKGNAGAVVAVGTALAMSVGGGAATVGGSVGGGSAGLSAAESAVVRGIQSKLPKAKRTARKSDSKHAWRQLGLRQGKQTLRGPAECWAVSFGEVQEYLARTPCRGVKRAQFPVVDDQGSTISVLVSQVRMVKPAEATRFRWLIDEHGSGDIRPILPDVPFTGHHYDSASRGRSVVVAEAEYRDGAGSPEKLDAVATAATALAPK